MNEKQIIGWTSAFIIVLAYFLLSINHVKSDSIEYNLMNLLGGMGLAYRVYLDKNYSNFVLELIFIGIAVFKVITV